MIKYFKTITFKAVGTILGLGGAKKILLRKFFLEHTFFSKGYNFVH